MTNRLVSVFMVLAVVFVGGADWNVRTHRSNGRAVCSEELITVR